jgi:hypothetical protein
VDLSDPSAREILLEDVQAGPNRIVYVEAEDAGGTLIANGCTDSIPVESGKTVEVEVVVWRLRP